MGLFLSKKNKKKNTLTPPTGPSDPLQSPDPPRYQNAQRRMSRLDMGIPIEEVFSGIEFATVEKTKESRSKASTDHDIIDSPDDKPSASAHSDANYRDYLHCQSTSQGANSTEVTKQADQQSVEEHFT